jgi:hypothetical protein
MMLMTKFGKFKLRLIATINMGVLLSIFNIASTSSNYWYKWLHPELKTHVTAGLWRMCNSVGECSWQNGIVEPSHSFWSIFVRVFMAFGTFINILVVLFLIMALFYKVNKRSRCCIQLMEWTNCLLIGSFIIIFIGLCVFLSTSCNYSMWLHVAAMCFMIVTSNMITRTFATLYFKNTRSGLNSKTVETACSTAKIPCDPEEKIALSPINAENVVDNTTATVAIEMKNIAENNGSKEALIQTNVVTDGTNAQVSDNGVATA